VGLEYTDNFRHLPLVFEAQSRGEPTRFVIHDSPKEEQRNARRVGNYDLLIDLGYTTQFENADYISRRQNKIAQAVKLQEIATKIGAKWFEPVRVLCKGPNPSNMFDMVDLPDKVLIKSTDGARGVGHIVFDNTKASIFKFLVHLRNGGQHQAKEVLNEYRDAIEVHTGQLHKHDEVIDVLTSQQLMITAIVEDVTEEARVVTNHVGAPALIKMRERKHNVQEGFDKGTGYLQATGANRSDDTLLTSLYQIRRDSPMMDEITEFLGHLPPLNSVDLFFTKTGWGIFEYCNQFGTEAFEVVSSMKLHADFIAHLWNEKLVEELKAI
jgi:hypothetical protein